MLLTEGLLSSVVITSISDGGTEDQENGKLEPFGEAAGTGVGSMVGRRSRAERPRAARSGRPASGCQFTSSGLPQLPATISPSVRRRRPDEDLISIVLCHRCGGCWPHYDEDGNCVNAVTY